MPSAEATSGRSSTALSPEARRSTPIAFSPIFVGCSIGRSSATSLLSPAEKIKAPTAERSRDRTLTPAELAAVWNAAATLGAPFGAILRLLILTGQRRSEVAGARWTEFDLEKSGMDIPASRAKNGTRTSFTCAPAALVILTTTPRLEGSDFVFTTTGRRRSPDFRRIKARLDQGIWRERLDDPRSAPDVRNASAPANSVSIRL